MASLLSILHGRIKVTLIDDRNGFQDELARIKPAEILISEAADLDLDDFTHESNPTLTKTASRSWYPDTCRHLLAEHFQVQNLAVLGLDHILLIQSAGAILAYLQETQKSTLAHVNQITKYSLSEYLQIDAASFCNLELARTIREGKGRFLLV